MANQQLYGDGKMTNSISESLDSDQVADLAVLWKTCQRFQEIIGISSFSFQALEDAILSRRLSPLLIEVHICILRALLEEEHERWKNASRAVPRRQRKLLSMDLLKVGLWESLLGEFIGYREGLSFQQNVLSLRSLNLEKAGPHQSTKVDCNRSSFDPNIASETHSMSGWKDDVRCVLASVMCDKSAQCFLQPMHKVLGISEHDYLAVIETPMCFEQIFQRLSDSSAESTYSSVDEILTDLEMIWDNCAAYFNVRSPPVEYAKRLFSALNSALLSIQKHYSKVANIAGCSVDEKSTSSQPDSNLEDCANSLQNGDEGDRLGGTNTLRRSSRGRARRKTRWGRIRPGGRNSTPQSFTNTPRRDGNAVKPEDILTEDQKLVQSTHDAYNEDEIPNRPSEDFLKESNFCDGDLDAYADGSDDVNSEEEEQQSLADDDALYLNATGSDMAELIPAVNILLMNGFEDLSLIHRLTVLRWLCDRLLDSAKVRESINGSIEALSNNFNTLDQLEGGENKEIERIEIAHSERVDSLMREMRSYRRSSGRKNQTQNLHVYPPGKPVALDCIPVEKLSQSMIRRMPQSLGSPSKSGDGQHDLEVFVGRAVVAFDENNFLNLGVIRGVKRPSSETLPSDQRTSEDYYSKTNSRPRRSARAYCNRNSNRSGSIDSDISVNLLDCTDKANKAAGTPQNDLSMSTELAHQNDQASEPGKSSIFAKADSAKPEDDVTWFECIFDDGNVKFLSVDDVGSYVFPDDNFLKSQTSASSTEASSARKPQFLYLLDDNTMCSVGDVVLTKYGFGRIDDILKTNTESIPMYTVALQWNGVAEDISQCAIGAVVHLADKDLLYVLVKYDQLRKLLEERNENMYETDLLNCRDANSSLVKRRRETEKEIDAINQKLHHTALAKLPAAGVVAWEFDGFINIERVLVDSSQRQRIIVRDRKGLLKLSKEGVREVLSNLGVDEHNIDDFDTKIRQAAIQGIATLDTCSEKLSNGNSHKDFVNKAQTTLPIPPLLLRLCGERFLYDTYDAWIALRYCFIRMEGNAVAFTPKRYRQGPEREDVLRKIKMFSSSGKQGEVYSEILLKLDSLVIEYLSDLESVPGLRDIGPQNETRGVPVVTSCPNIKVAGEILRSRNCTLSDVLTAKTYEAFSDELEIVRLCFESFFVANQLPPMQIPIDQVMAWVSKRGIRELDEQLVKRHSKSLIQYMLDCLEAVDAAYPQRLDLGNVPEASKVSAEYRIRFLEDWLPIRSEWRSMLLSADYNRRVDTLLNSLLVFEQSLKHLFSGLTFAGISKMFSDPCRTPSSFYELKVGDVAIYDSSRHQHVYQLEKNLNLVMRRKLFQDGFSNDVLLKSIRGFTPLWLGDEPKAGDSSGKFTVLDVEYYPGSGEPYSVVTLQKVGDDVDFPRAGSNNYIPGTPINPQVAMDSVYDSQFSSEESYRGRKRNYSRRCKTEFCDRFVIEGNFGYCEVHREVANRSSFKPMAMDTYVDDIQDARERYSIGSMSPNVGNEVKTVQIDSTCFVCLGEGNMVSCDLPDCPRVYHLDCLRCSSLPKSEWQCPVHAKSSVVGIEELNRLILKILERICGMPSACAFLNPVESPGYCEEIERPMCLQDMRWKALNLKYSLRSQFLNDAILMSSNCEKWCRVRFPSLPPKARKLLIFASKAVHRESAAFNALEAKIKENNSTADIVDAVMGSRSDGDGEDCQSDSMDSKSNLSLGKRKAIRLSRSDADRPPRIYYKRSDATRERATMLRQSSLADRRASKTVVDCGTCPNCLLRSRRPLLRRNPELVRNISCCKRSKRMSKPGFVTVKNQRYFSIETPANPDCWENPSGSLVGFKDVDESLYVVVVPLSRRSPVFLLSTQGWKEFSKAEAMGGIGKQHEIARMRMAQQRNVAAMHQNANSGAPIMKNVMNGTNAMENRTPHSGNYLPYAFYHSDRNGRRLPFNGRQLIHPSLQHGHRPLGYMKQQWAYGIQNHQNPPMGDPNGSYPTNTRFSSHNPPPQSQVNRSGISSVPLGVSRGHREPNAQDAWPLDQRQRIDHAQMTNFHPQGADQQRRLQSAPTQPWQNVQLASAQAYFQQQLIQGMQQRSEDHYAHVELPNSKAQRATAEERPALLPVNSLVEVYHPETNSKKSGMVVGASWLGNYQVLFDDSGVIEDNVLPKHVQPRGVNSEASN